jgi:adenylate kinase family enzyme
MYDYDFHSLNDKEFESLSQDLLQAHLNITLEGFKVGKDKGIDFRYIHESNKEKLIVQVKHWRKSGIKKLISYLKSTELPKIKILKPTRYILTTSIELNQNDKNEIKKILSPYIISEADIFGKEDLNNLLGLFKKIEEKHYKLWLSSTNTLRKILNNGIQGRSEFVAENIIRNIKLYVSNNSHKKALEVLNSERFLVIIGEPGIGKTTLARMIIYELLSTDYELVVIDNIRDAESLWKPESKQVFYFDDFLGSNYLELMGSKNDDSNLINFIKRAKEDPTKRLILTSRTTILNQAENKLSKLKNSVIDLSKHEVKVEDYSKFDKALILYNHLYFNDIADDFYTKITEDKNYFKIINHKNFNPRIIEFITDPNRLKTIDINDYLKFILKNLDCPSLIWENPYEQQIDDYSRFLLTTLFSLDKPKETTLQKAFDARLEYEIKNGNFQRINNAFTNKVKDLLGGFIIASRNDVYTEYNFFNPSIIDFMMEYLKKNPSEKWRIIESVIFIEQITLRFKTNYLTGSVTFTQEELSRLYKIIKAKEVTFEFLDSGSKNFSLLNLYYNFFDIDEIKDDILRLLSQINWYEISSKQRRDLIYLLESLSSYDWAQDIITQEWNEIIECLFRNATEEEELENIIRMFDLYNKDYYTYIEDPSNKLFVTSQIERYWKSRIHDIQWSNEEVASCFSEQEVINCLDNIHSEGLSFNSKFGITTNILDKISEIDPAEIAESNNSKAQAEDHLNDIQKEDWKFERAEERELDEKITYLFDSSSKNM